jgi:hypothetical protein
MDNKKRTLTCLFIFLGLVAIIAMIFYGYRFLTLRARANVVHPQVLIHRPFNQQVISPESSTFLHATARAEVGISRIEVWADGEFLYAQEAPESGVGSPMVLHTYWQPNGLGLHEIVVRAYDADEVEGIASIIVVAEESTGEEVEAFDPTGIVEAGEYPEDMEPSSETDISSDAGDSESPEDVEPSSETDISSDAGDSESPEDAEPSSETDIPPDSGDSESPEAGSSGPPMEPADHSPADPASPPPEDETPPEPLQPIYEFRFFELFDFVGLGEDEGENLPDSSGPLLLKLEALDLNTLADYEGVHCYIGMGGGIPAWYPDSDNNPDTDEYFEDLGFGLWNIADHLANDNGVVVHWPSGDPLPFEITCIGSANGGTEAIDLGRIESEIPSSEWDGITRQVTAAAEGTFTLNYRITMEEPVPLALIPDMPPPFNVHIDDRRQELHWEWERPEDFEGPTPSYLVFVNDILVFQANHTTRAVRLPYIWFGPPCDVTYTFTMVAYQRPYPEGDYSPPSEPVYLPDPDEGPRTDCEPEFLVSFDTLITGDLGGDDIPNNWANMVRPVAGSLFGNDKSVDFSNVTLLPNQTYAISELVGSSGSSHFVYEALEDEYLRIGFDLIDSDDGSSELLCTNSLFHDYTYNRLMGYGYFEDILYSLEDDGRRCQVHYTIQPVAGSAFGLDIEGSIPLPWIDVTGLRVDPTTGFVQVDVKNSGNAEWSNHTLWLSIFNRERDRLFGNHIEELFLDIGQEKTITTDVTVSNIANVCIVVDPDDIVLELYENTGALYHATMRYCLPLPDLWIQEAQYNVDENKLRINIRNQGDRSSNIGPGNQVDVYDLVLRLEPDLGIPYFYSLPHQFGHDLLDYNDSAWVEWTLRPGQRERLLDGYTITLDPEDDIVEIDETNNTFTMEGGTNMRVAWDGIQARWYPSWLQDCTNDGAWAANDIEVWVDIYARTELSSRHLGSWFWEGSISDSYRISEYNPNYAWNTQNNLIDFYIHGEENLVFELRGEQDNDSMGSAVGTFYNWENWEIMETINSSPQECDEGESRDMGYDLTAYPPNSSWSYCGGWSIYVNICEVRE